MTEGTCDRCGTSRPEYAGVSGYAYARLCAPCLADLASRATSAPTALDDAQRPSGGAPTYIPPLRQPAPPAPAPTCTHCGLRYTPEHDLPHWSDGQTASWDLAAVPAALGGAAALVPQPSVPVPDPARPQDGERLAYARILDFLDRIPPGDFDAATVQHIREAVLVASLMTTAQ